MRSAATIGETSRGFWFRSAHVRVTVYSEFDSARGARNAVQALGRQGYLAEYSRDEESQAHEVVARASTSSWFDSMKAVQHVADEHGGTVKDSWAEDSAVGLVKGARAFCDYHGPRRGMWGHGEPTVRHNKGYILRLASHLEETLAHLQYLNGRVEALEKAVAGAERALRRAKPPS